MLSPSQQEAVCHGMGPCLTLAGPGSGKTYVLIRRIQHLITNNHILPENILVITFTKAAALEMKVPFCFLWDVAAGFFFSKIPLDGSKDKKTDSKRNRLCLQVVFRGRRNGTHGAGNQLHQKHDV